MKRISSRALTFSLISLSLLAPLGAMAQYSASLGADLTVFPTVNAGVTGAPIAAFTLNSANSNVNLNVASLPVSAAFGGGLTSNHLTNCAWRNGNLVIANGQNGTIISGPNAFGLPNTLAVAGGVATPTTLVLSCDVSASAPVGGQMSLSFSPGALGVANAINGAMVTATVGPLNSTGGTATIMSSASTGGTPGVPNTGAGGEAPLNVAVMALALAGILGAFYALARKPSQEERF